MRTRLIVRTALACTVGQALVWAAWPVLAQESPPTESQSSGATETPQQNAPVPVPAAAAASAVAPAPKQKLERVEITGSRIASPNAQSAAPLQVITSEQIAASGATNVQQLLLANPATGAPTISRTNSNFATSSVGVSSVDLRNLGTARTLVLVNGRRYVSGVPGESTVDLNTIPTDFVERIEILTGGSSAAYGSDAVAGVVNVILKRNFEGLALNAHVGRSALGDDRTQRFGATFGANAEGGRSNVMGYVGYSDQGAVNSRDRAFAAIDQISLGVTNGNPADLFTPLRPFLSSFAPQGTFTTGSGSKEDPFVVTTFDDKGNIIPVNVNGSAGQAATGFNRSDFRTIAVPTQRFLLASKGEHAVSDDHTVFFEGLYAGTRAQSALEPFPLSSGDIYPATGNVPVEFLVNGVRVRNPLVPDAIFNRATDTDGDGLRDFSFTRRLAEVGARQSTASRDTYRFVVGAKGSVLTSWDYQVYGSTGATQESQTSSGQVNVLNFRNALEAIPDANGRPVCRDPNAVAQGCVPINVFGFGTISPEALAYVTAPGSLSTLTRQHLLGGSLSGEPMTLPAGPLGVALGFEHRDEFSRSEFDALTQSGLNAGNAIPATRGRFNVKELFGEVRLPLLKGVRVAQSLNATAGLRVGSYSTVGRTVSGNVGMDWLLNSSLKMRASRALSTRAPNVSELFQAPSQTFPADLNDPCANVAADTPGARAAACRADPGVAANIAANGRFLLNQADLQGVSGFDRGNPAVREEKGHSWSLGVVLTPEAFKQTAFTLDYFNIRVADAIVSTPRQFILDQCYGGDASFCQFVTRRQRNTGPNSAGSLQFIDSGVTNSGELATAGVDLTAAYRDNLAGGQLSAQLSYTYLLDGYVVPLPGAAKDSFRGEIGSSVHKGSLSLGYKWGPVGFYTHVSYVGAAALDDQFLAGFELAPGSVKVGSRTYTDLQLTYSPSKPLEVYFGVDNAFDLQPVPILTGLPGNDTGTETAAGVYDAIGRRYYMGLRLKL